MSNQTRLGSLTGEMNGFWILSCAAFAWESSWRSLRNLVAGFSETSSMNISRVLGPYRSTVLSFKQRRIKGDVSLWDASLVGCFLVSEVSRLSSWSHTIFWNPLRETSLTISPRHDGYLIQERPFRYCESDYLIASRCPQAPAQS